MVLTEEERKERRKEYNKRYKQKNKDKTKEYNKEYHQINKDYYKEYRLNNKEHIKEWTKEYRQTPNGRKRHRIGIWKTRGVIHDDFDKLYEYYINTNECNICKMEFTDKNWKCLDHDHTNGQFRQILCNNCNSYDNWKNKV